MPENSVHIGEGSYSVTVYIVWLKFPLSQYAMDERTLVTLRHLVKNQREGVQSRCAVLGKPLLGDTGDRGGVQPPTQRRTDRKGTAQATAYRRHEDIAKCLSVRLIRAKLDLTRRVEGPIGLQAFSGTAYQKTMGGWKP